MSYYYEIIKSRPCAFYMFDEEGTVATDYSGYSNDASMNFSLSSGRLPLVANTEMGMKMSTGDTIDYPLLPIWGASQNSYSFTIEFWIYDYDGVNATIFAPVDDNGALVDVGIFLEDGRLSFRTGDATGLAAPSTYFHATCQLANSKTAHYVVVEYTKSGVSINVDNGVQKVTSKQTMRQNLWTHDLQGFITEVHSGNMMIDCLSIYQRRMEGKELNAHWFSAVDTRKDMQFISSEGGFGFPLTNEDFTNYLYLSYPVNSPWNYSYSDNVFVKNNKLSLREIRPAVLNTGSATFVDSKLDLQSGQYLTVSNFNDNTTSEGAISGMFYYDSTQHASGEYFFFDTVNGDSSIGLVSIDGMLNIRHSYVDNGITEVDYIEYGALEEDQLANVFLMWSGGMLTVYLDDWDNPLQYDTSSAQYFSFKNVTSMTIGAATNGSGLLENSVSTVSIWNRIPNVENDFMVEIATVGVYTLKLEDSLSVSQKGQAIFQYNLTGLIEPATESRVNYYPVNSNITVTQTKDGETFEPVVDGQPIMDFSYGDIIGDTIENYYIYVDLETDDSYFDIPEVFTLSLFIASKSKSEALIGYTAVPTGTFNTGELLPNVLVKYEDNGIRLVGDGSVKIYKQSIEFEPEEGRPIPNTPPRKIHTVEMFIKRNEDEANAVNFYSSSEGEEFILQTIDDDIVTTGFRDCWVNTISVGTGTTSEQLLLDEWNHVVLALDEGQGFTRENLIENPRLFVDSTYWGDYPESSGVRMTGAAPYGQNEYEMVASTTGTTGYGAYIGIGTMAFPAEENEYYAGVIFAKTESEERELTVGLKFYDVSGSLISEVRSDPYSDYEWYTQFCVTGISPTGTESIGLDVVYESGVEPGEKHYLANAMIEKTNTLYPYFDGDFSGAYWGGTTGASSSIQPIGILIDDNDYAYIGTTGSIPDNSSFNYMDLSFYQDSFDQEAVDKSYGNWIGSHKEVISDDNASEYDPLYDLPLDFSDSNDEDYEKIEDVNALLVVGNWSTFD